MQPEFSVEYSIDTSEWARTAAARLDPEVEPIFDCFYGDVQIVARGRGLLGPDGYNMSVADLACGLAVILRRDLPALGGQHSARYEQSDDSLEIRFDRRGDVLGISTNIAAATMPSEVAFAAFLEGTKRFLRKFAHEAALHVEDVFAWKDLGVLREYWVEGSSETRLS